MGRSMECDASHRRCQSVQRVRRENLSSTLSSPCAQTRTKEDRVTIEADSSPSPHLSTSSSRIVRQTPSHSDKVMFSTLMHATAGSSSRAAATTSAWTSVKGIVAVAASVGVAVIMRCKKRRGKDGGKKNAMTVASDAPPSPTAAPATSSSSDESASEDESESPTAVECVDSIPSVIGKEGATSSPGENSGRRKLRGQSQRSSQPGGLQDDELTLHSCC